MFLGGIILVVCPDCNKERAITEISPVLCPHCGSEKWEHINYKKREENKKDK